MNLDMKRWGGRGWRGECTRGEEGEGLERGVYTG